MCSRKMVWKIKRALAGLLMAGVVFTGMPAPGVWAANEVVEEPQPDEAVEDSASQDGTTGGGEDLGPDGEKPSDADKPGDGEGSSGIGQPDGAESTPDENMSGEGDQTEQDKENPGGAGGTDADNTSQPGTENADGEETGSGEEEEVTGEDVSAEASLYHIQVSGNDISGNDLAETGSDEVWITVEGGGSYQEGAFTVPDEEAGSRPRRAAAVRARQTVADYIYEQIKEKSPEIDVSGYNILVENLKSLMLGVLNDHPDLYFAKSSYSYVLSGNGTVAKIMPVYFDAILDDGKFQQAVREALASVEPDMTELEKAVALHDYLVLNCEYDMRLFSGGMPDISYSAYGVLVERVAVCQGYALAYKYLLNQVGIECYMVTSDAMHHAWNLIKLEGDYYQVDVTWDDPVDDRFGQAGHNYMFVSDDAFRTKSDERDSHYDWVITTGSNSINLVAKNERYDDAFWVDVTSPIVFDGQNCFYIKQLFGIVKRDSLVADAEKNVYKLGIWTAPGGGYYNEKFSGLFRLGKRLYFNSMNEICSVSLEGSAYQAETEKLSTSERAVYGCAYLQGEVKYLLRVDPNTSSNMSILPATFKTPVYQVTFNSQGHGIAPSVLTGLNAGDKIVRPSDPTEAGYVFGGWYIDEACTEEWDFDSDTVRESLTLYAKWEKEPISLVNAVITFWETDFTYDKTAKEPKTEVTASGAKLAEGTDYTLSYMNNINAGTATVTVEGIGNYSGTVTKNFTIQQAPLKIKADNITIQVDDPFPPEYSYKITEGELFGDDKLVREPSYSCEAASSAKKGKYVITPYEAKVGHNGNEENNYSITYEEGILTIEERPVVSYRVSFDMQGHGTEPTGYGSIVAGSKIEKPADPTAAGYVFGGWYRDAACVTAWNFDKDTVDKDLTLYAKWEKETGSLANAVVTLLETDFTYDKTAKEPKVEVKVSGAKLAEGTDYSLSYENNINAGTAMVKAKGNGDYSGEASKTFRIKRAKITIKAKNVRIRVGEAIPEAYEYDAIGLVDGDKLVKEPSLQCGITSSAAENEYAIVPFGAEAGSNYEIEAYENGKLTVVDEYTYYRVSFDVQGHGTAPASLERVIAGETVEKPVDPTADGYVFGGWYRDAACTLAWNFDTDTVESDLKLYAKWSKELVSLTKAYISLAETDFTYNGAEQKPEVLVSVSGVRLVEGTDYTLSYGNNKNAGTAIVTVVGINDYKDTASKTFTIKKAFLSIWAKDKVILVGAPVPAQYEYGAEGLLAGDRLLAEPALSCGIVDTMVEGSYDIVPSGADAGSNYAISYMNGKLRVVAEMVSYTVTFDVQGHGMAPAGYRDVLIGSTIEKPADPMAEGYLFDGWYRDGACKTAWNFDRDTVQADMTLYAKWVQETIPIQEENISLEAEVFSYDGTRHRPKVTVVVSGVTLVEGQDYRLVYKNNRDAGIARVTVFGMGSYSGEAGKTFRIEGLPLVIRAKDKTILRGDPIPAENGYEYEVAGLLDGDKLTKEPTFVCAIKSSEVAGQYDIVPVGADAGKSYSITYEPGILTVADEYVFCTVTFNRMGHGGASSGYVGVKVGATIIEPEEPAAEGYRFAGWYRDAACTQAWDFENDIVLADLTLYAKWLQLAPSDNAGGFALQEIADFYYTGKPCKPAVSVYDGETLLRAGRDYQIKYYNNINVNADGLSRKGSGTGNDFNASLPYVEIVGKGNYTETTKVNFNILRASIGDGGEDPAAGVALKVNGQLVTKAGGAWNPFSSIRYVKAMRQNVDYTVTLTAVDAKDTAGGKITGELGGAVIPAGCSGEFLLTVAGIGNYDGSICRPVYVADKAHLMKNAVVTLGRNQKNVTFAGRAVELTAGEESSADIFTVKCGGVILKPGKDYTVGYRDNDKVGRAELIVTGKGAYAGSKTVAFHIKGAVFSAKTVKVSGIADQVYSGRAWTQNNAVLTDTAANRKLVYGVDYTISYSKNVNKGTATMTFRGMNRAGYSGSFKKTFKITAADINRVNRVEDMGKLVFDYCKAGVRPVEQVVLMDQNGYLLKNGRDYTLQYVNNKAVANTAGSNPPMVIVKGKGNYAGEFSVPFEIIRADLAGITVQTTPVAYKSNRGADFAYRPAVKLMDGKSALRAGRDYEITYRNNTQADYDKYMEKWGDMSNAGLSPADGGAPVAVISEKAGSAYRLEKPIVIPLPVYQKQFRKTELTIELGEALYTGSQARPSVRVSYGSILLEEGRDYTVSYGANVKSGKNRGSVTVSGIAPEYGGSVTVKFDITRKPITY